MKKIKQPSNSNFLKKIFIKICRIFGYEIIDQSNFYVPTQEKILNKNLSIQGKKSINLPLGEIKISRKVSSFTVIFRSCTKINMLTQNKKRLFDKEKSEYTFRSLNSIIKSLNHSIKTFPNISFDIVIIDYNSKSEDLDKIKNILTKSDIKNSMINLNVNEFKNNINKINAKNENVTNNQVSNMCNIYKSLIIAKNQSNDLIYFVEDDYIHLKETFNEMIFTYERISSQLNKELILCPADYPYLYTKIDPSIIFLGANKHWRRVEETLCTFCTSKILINKYWDKFVSMCKFEHYPFEQPLHEIYKSEYCLSPIPSLAIHCTNINSIFGLSPNINWKESWDENKDY
jgi:archaellin